MSTMLDIELFQPLLLKESSAVENALHSISRSVGGATVDATLKLLLSRPNLTEFVLSAVDQQTSARLTSWVMNCFPKSPDGFADSIARRLLSQLSLSMLAVAHQADLPERLEKCRRDVELIFPVLQALSLLVSTEYTSSELPAWSDGGHFTWTDQAGEWNSRVVFQSLKRPVPTSSDDAKRLSSQLLCELKDILQYYFDVLRRPEFATTFKQSYIPAESDSIPGHYLGKDVETSDDTSLPSKEVLYSDNIKGFGKWRVLVSGRAEQDLREWRRRDKKIFLIIIKKIRDLSIGHFSADNHHRLEGSKVGIPIFIAKMTGDTRLVYQVDCVRDSESQADEQVLRIFGVYTHAQLDRAFWDSVSKQLSKRGKTYEKRCKARKNSGGDMFSPIKFYNVDEDMPSESPSYLSMREKDFDQIHSLLVLGKFFSFSQALLNSIWVEVDVAHVFEVSAREMEIIDDINSCYVIGRSGTGKTTTMVFRMLRIEGSWKLSTQMTPRPRQTFVTQSPVLADKVEKYYSRLSESLAAAQLSAGELKELVSTRTTSNQDPDFSHPDDEDLEEGWSHLPKKFSLLQDEHFPMFITFNRLSALLEADMVMPKSTALSNRKSSNTWMRYNDISSGDYMQQRRPSFVSYGTFLESYWGHFPAGPISGLDPSLVFSEFMGVIKGSEKTLDLQDHYLDRQSYLDLSRRSHSTFAHRREDIYDLFESYLDIKRKRREQDAADRTHRIIHNIRNNGLLGQKIDFLYVDEVQDNLLIDSLLLRSITRNRDGLFWAGDTAQTISVGKAFRFKDLKAFQYRIEKQTSEHHDLPAAQPKDFHLSVNYRSHAGIANCAHSVIELLEKYWPNSLDKLAAEQGVVDGCKPVFFTYSSLETFRYEQLTFGDSKISLEFGHEQCILVRHDAAKNALKERLGEAAIILTIYDSKGSEYDDVLLWDFFEDSTASLPQWRVVLNEVDGAHMLSPMFDENKHSLICSELKSLYVAITRSRKRLWIFDRSERAEPMRKYWTSKGRIENGAFHAEDLLPKVASSQEEWAQRGEDLFYKHNFSEAVLALKKAGRYREAAIADAYNLRELARSTQSGDTAGTRRVNTFTHAAEAFLGCANNTDDKKEEQRKRHLKVAADCWSHAGKYAEAAKTYMQASKYALGAEAYCKAAMFDEMVKVVKSYEKDIERDSATDMLREAARFYFKGGKLDKGLGTGLFLSSEEALSFMESHGFVEVRIVLLKRLGRTAGVAEQLYSTGRFGEAIRCVLIGLWDRLSFGTSYHKSDTDLTRLVKQAPRMEIKRLSRTEHSEIVMFQCIASSDITRLHELYRESHDSGSKASALLCLDHILSLSTVVETTPYEHLVASLRVFPQYHHLLVEFSSNPDLITDNDCQKLFSFQRVVPNRVLLPKNTLLYRSASENTQLSKEPQKDDYLVAETDFSAFFAKTISDHIKRRIGQLFDVSRDFTTSLRFLTSGKCHGGHHDHSDRFCLHIGRNEATVLWYNSRIEFFILQCSMLQLISRDKRVTQERSLIRGLYDVLHPPIHWLGSLANLDTRYIPDADSGLKAIRKSIRNVCKQSASPPSQETYYVGFLTHFMKAISMAFAFDRVKAPIYLPESGLVKDGHCNRLACEDGSYVTEKFTSSLQGDSKDCIFDGLVFLRFVLDRRIPVDIGVVCGFVDFLCGFIIISRHFYRWTSLHNVILPRSWLVLLSPFFSKLQNRYRPEEVESLLELTRELLARLYAASDNDASKHLMYHGKKFSDDQESSFIRDIYISRICRSTGLLCVNIQVEKIRREIFGVVTSLRNDIVYLHNSYALVEHWEELYKLVLNSATGSWLDEMICLRHAAKEEEPTPCLGNLRLVVYRKMKDIRNIIVSRPIIIIDGVSHTGASGDQTGLASTIERWVN